MGIEQIVQRVRAVPHLMLAPHARNNRRIQEFIYVYESCGDVVKSPPSTEAKGLPEKKPVTLKMSACAVKANTVIVSSLRPVTPNVPLGFRTGVNPAGKLSLHTCRHFSCT